MMDLVIITIKIWADGEIRGDESIQRAEHWLCCLQQRLEIILKSSAVSSSEDVEAEHLIPLVGPTEDVYQGVIKACKRSRKMRNLEKAFEFLHEITSRLTFVWAISEKSVNAPTIYEAAKIFPST